MVKTVQEEASLASARLRIAKMQAGEHQLASVAITFLAQDARQAGLDLDTEEAWQELGITRDEFFELAEMRLIEDAQRNVQQLRDGFHINSVCATFAIQNAKEAGLDLDTDEGWDKLGITRKEFFELAGPEVFN